MKILITAVALGALTVPALAQMGMPAGSEAAGKPLNSSVSASGIDPATGHSPGYRAHGQLRCHNVLVRKTTASGRIVHRNVRRCW